MHEPAGQDLLVWLWGMLGGAFRELHQAYERGVVPPLSKIVANTSISGFVAFIAAKFVLKIEPEWAVAVAGIAGYLGVTTFNIILDFLARRP